MLFEILLFLLLGVLAGTFTGLIPGVHINLVGASIVALYAGILSKISPIYLVTFISSMAITHTFIDFIPSIFLGVPDTDTELSILPGHELLKEGKGYEAIILTAYGSVAALFVLILISLPSTLILAKLYPYLQKIIPYVLLAVIGFLAYNEKHRAATVLLVILATGLLGFVVLNLPHLREPLLPLLTGLFGSSMLIISIKNKTKIPNQKITSPRIGKSFLAPLFGATIASPLSSLLPGLGSGQAAILGNTISRAGQRGFLFLLGATNTLVMGFSFIALYAVSRTRTGAAVAIEEILGNFSSHLLVLILAVVLIAGSLSFFITKILAKIISEKITEIDYTKISFVTLSFLGVVVFLFSGGLGILVLVIATLTGIYCISLGVRRTNMMGCLLIPTILFYLL